MEHKKADFKVGQKVKHRWRPNWYQKCVVIEVEDGCNGGIKVLCQDSPIYSTEGASKGRVVGFKEDTSTFCPQDLSIINQ